MWLKTPRKETQLEKEKETEIEAHMEEGVNIWFRIEQRSEGLTDDRW